MFRHGKYGISKEGDIIDLGVALGIIKKAGTFFTYGDLKLGQGRENARDYLWKNAELASKIEQEIRTAAKSSSSSGAEKKEISD
jgi:recombination protein RecA